MKTKAYLGIDPGRSGCLALVHPEGHELHDWQDVSLAADQVTSWRLGYDIQMTAVEQVSSRPGQGVRSVFNFGCVYGEIRGVLAALQMPFLLVTPQRWRKGLICKADGSDPKAASLAVARRVFPDASLARKKDHNRADALLLAWWARQKF